MSTATTLFEVPVEVPGDGGLRTLQMPITWAAYRDLCQAGIDPTTAATGKVELRSDQYVTVIHRGLRAGGHDIDEAALGEAIVRRGIVRYAEVAGLYLAGLVLGGVPDTSVRKSTTTEAAAPGNAPGAGGSSSETPTNSP